MNTSLRSRSLGVLALLALLQSSGTFAGDAPKTEEKDGVVIERDIEFGKVGVLSLKLDICRPRDASAQRRPALIWIHGGGWMMGDNHWGIAPRPAYMKPADERPALAKRGYVIASINYRIVKEAKFPAAIEDCKCAVRWMRENAAKYSVDPERIGAAGASAGGHLALLLACADERAGLEGTGGHAEFSSRVQAACSWFGPTDFAAKGHSDLYQKTVADFVGGPYEQNKEKYAKASPVTYVSKSAPPILLIHGEDDNAVAFSDSETMAEKLKAAGADVTLIPVKHAGHDFRPTPKDAKISPSADEILENMIGFFDKHLRNAAGAK